MFAKGRRRFGMGGVYTQKHGQRGWFLGQTFDSHLVRGARVVDGVSYPMKQKMTRHASGDSKSRARQRERGLELLGRS